MLALVMSCKKFLYTGSKKHCFDEKDFVQLPDGNYKSANFVIDKESFLRFQETDQADFEAYTKDGVLYIEEQNPVLKFKEFEVGKPLGRGGSASVYLARKKSTKNMYALKMIDLKASIPKIYDEDEDEDEDEDRKSKHVSEKRTTLGDSHIQEEIVINLLLRHPNIVRCYGTFSEGDRLFMLFEYATLGSLYEKELELEEIKKVAKDCFRGLEYAHSKGICHRDIKLENILIFQYGNEKVYKLGDWGLGGIHGGKLLKGVFGTLDYLPPEMIDGKKYDCNKVDIWMMGIVMYELTHGYPPFEAEKTRDTYMMILRENPSYKRDLDPQCKDFISTLLQKKPENRPTAAQVLKHPFLA